MEATDYLVSSDTRRTKTDSYAHIRIGWVEIRGDKLGKTKSDHSEGSWKIREVLSILLSRELNIIFILNTPP